MRVKYLLLAAMLTLTMLATTIPARADTTNLIKNPSVENLDLNGNPANWTANSWGTNSAFTSLKISEGHTGSNSLYVSLSSRVNGDAKWIPDAVAVTANTSYTYTDYYKASVGTELDLEYTDTSGNVSYIYALGLPASTDWSQSTVTFTTPANVRSVSVLHILAANGWLQTDDFSLSTTVTLPTPPVTPPTPTPVPTDGNLISNPSFETANGPNPLNWQTGNWGTNTTSFSYDTTGHTGSRSATVSMSAYTNGDAKWYANPVSVTPGASYAYSDYYKSGVITHVVAAYTDAVGNISYVNLPDAAASATWSQYSTNFTAPATAKQVVIYHLISSVGSLSIDDVSLTAVSSTTPPQPPVTPPTNGSNLIANASVESSSNGTTPDGWLSSAWGTNQVAFTYVNDGHTGSKSIRTTVSQYTDGDAKWYFTPISTPANATYTYSVWMKSSVQASAVAAYTMSDGTTQYATLPAVPAPNTTTWQQYTSTLQTPAGVKNTTVYMLIAGVGWVQTDDYSLTPYVPTGFNEGLVTITFDDGWTSTYTNGLPLLKKYNLPSTEYIISGYIGAPMYMTKAQIQAFIAQGSEVGSHTVDHPDLTTLTPTQLTNELVNSQKTLQSLFGTSAATTLATPYGSYNTNVLNNVMKYYRAQRSTDVGFNSKDNFNASNIVVQNVDYDTPNSQVESWVAQAKAQKTWLVLVYHQVENTMAPGDIYAVKTSNLDTQLSYIKSSGISVKTMSKALSEVQSQF